MKILALLTDSYGGHGGIAQYNRDMLDALSAMPEVTTIISLPRVAPNESLARPAKLVEHAIAGSLVTYVWRALSVALKTRPDVILCGHINLLPLAAVIKRGLGLPLAIELYGVEAWEPVTLRFRDWSLRQVDLAIAISRYTRRKFVEWAAVSPSKVKVVPNAIHLERYPPASASGFLRERYGLQGRKVLLTVGRVVRSERYKGHDRIIRLMPRLLERYPELVYVIAGNGDDLGRLEDLAAERGVREHVRFIGYVPVDEMTSLYSLADAFAMPSTGEGFGFVFLEAAACGVPVLGGSVDGSPDALADGRIGLMVDPADEEALCHGLLMLLEKHREVPGSLAAYDFPGFGRQVRQLVLSMRGLPRAE